MTGQKRKADIDDVNESALFGSSFEADNGAVETTDQSGSTLHIQSSISAEQEVDVQQADEECFTASTPTQNTDGNVAMSFAKDDNLEESVMSPVPVESESSLLDVSNAVVTGKSSAVDSSTRVASKKIKHPSSAWMIFSLENREKIQKDQPSLTFTEGTTTDYRHIFWSVLIVSFCAFAS